MSTAPTVPTISASDARERWRAAPEGVVLLDVREPDEWLRASVDGATRIPMSEIPARVSELDREKEVVVFCHHGGRSAHVVRWLLSSGFSRAQNVRGGIDAWSLEVDASVPRYRR